jgi:hypothetical protein
MQPQLRAQVSVHQLGTAVMKGVPSGKGCELTIRKIPKPVHKLLAAAVQRRKMPVDALALQIVVGTVLKGSI